MKTKEQLGGLYPATVTAYDAAGRIDAAAQQRVMERNLAEGAAGFFVGGSSAECFLLTEAERKSHFPIGTLVDKHEPDFNTRYNTIRARARQA